MNGLRESRESHRPWQYQGGRRHFLIPNTEEGQRLVREMRAHLNTATYGITVRGTHRKPTAPRKHGYVPQADAQSLNVYIDRLDGKVGATEEQHRQAISEIHRLREHNRRLRDQMRRLSQSARQMIIDLGME
jgi:hypothetical protein